MGWSGLNPAELMEIINSITVYKNPTQNFVGIIDYLQAGYQTDPEHSNSDIVNRGSFKYYTYGERRLMKAIGPINNIHNSFSNQGNAAITRFNENVFGSAIELAGIKLKHKKSKGQSGTYNPDNDPNNQSDFADDNSGSSSNGESEFAGGGNDSSDSNGNSDFAQ